MLELAEWSIGPWQKPPGAAVSGRVAWYRALSSPVDHATGVLRYASPWPMSPWSWRRPCLELFETCDNALLLEIRRAWMAPHAWWVRDADGALVGELVEDALLDPHHQRFAVRRRSSPSTWILEEITGREYARLEREEGGRERLLFTDTRLTNPFLRMLVVASFLLLQPYPSLSDNEPGLLVGDEDDRDANGRADADDD